MVEKTLTDYDRLDLNFHRSMVKEVLPEYFTDEYPNLITFLEGYYEFLDSGDNFGALIQDLYTIRDVEASSLTHLDNMFKEFAQGMSQDFFIFYVSIYSLLKFFVKKTKKKDIK